MLLFNTEQIRITFLCSSLAQLKVSTNSKSKFLPELLLLSVEFILVGFPWVLQFLFAKNMHVGRMVNLNFP